MAQRFSPGSIAYAKDGRAYTVEVVDGGTVYCTASNGVETEFPEPNLMTEDEWAGRSDGRRDVSYSRLKQSRTYSVGGENIPRAAANELLSKVERISPSLLDFTAFTVARHILSENNDDDLVAALSIIKSRQIFDEAQPEVRARLLAGVLSARADTLAEAAKLGDNLLRALIEKGLTSHGEAFEDFLDRPRK